MLYSSRLQASMENLYSDDPPPTMSPSNTVESLKPYYSAKTVDEQHLTPTSQLSSLLPKEDIKIASKRGSTSNVNMPCENRSSVSANSKLSKLSESVLNHKKKPPQ